MKILPRSFYDREPQIVAPDLLGKILVRRLDGSTTLKGKITEVEAYLPFNDPASHGSLKRTLKRESLYGEAGHAYVYGMRHHFLFNTVTQGEGWPGGVLIRGIAPLQGMREMMALRKKDSLKSLTDGPAKICQALGITTVQNGLDLTKSSSPVFILDAHKTDPLLIKISPRIGITKAADMLLRFYIEE